MVQSERDTLAKRFPATRAIALGLLLVSTGCGPETPPLEPVPFDSGALIGQRFHSEVELPINDSGGAPKVRWEIVFDEHLCTWGYHNVRIQGGFEVQPDGAILARFWPLPDWEVRGAYDPRSQRLVFDGEEYVLEKPLDKQVIRFARAADNPRLKQLVASLRQRGFALQTAENGDWRMAVSQPAKLAVHVRLWAFPVGTSLPQMQAAMPAQVRSQVLFNAASGLAMSSPIYRDAAGNDVEIAGNDDENLNQLGQAFTEYEAPDLPKLLGLSPDLSAAWSDRKSPQVQALVEYFRNHDLNLVYHADRDQWCDDPETADGVHVMLRALPKTADVLQMRCWANRFNLAFIINVRGHLAMSYPPETERGARLKELFLNYPGE